MPDNDSNIVNQILSILRQNELPHPNTILDRRDTALYIQQLVENMRIISEEEYETLEDELKEAENELIEVEDDLKRTEEALEDAEDALDELKEKYASDIKN